MSIEDDASIVLKALFDSPRDDLGRATMDGKQIQETTELEPPNINDAISVLEASGYVELLNYLGTAPFMFGQATITARGRFEYERASREDKEEPPQSHISHPLSPIGSPYGFDDEDWEYVTERKSLSDKLIVVMGYQFESEYYNTDILINNIKANFAKAVEESNAIKMNPKVRLEFQVLAAGYGEHLFNDIARSIIASDIAVFETSDLNPNVMIEMGVALTWGVRILPIKFEGRPSPPSDISGHTWAEYQENGASFVDPDHSRKLFRMVERGAKKKSTL